MTGDDPRRLRVVIVVLVAVIVVLLIRPWGDGATRSAVGPRPTSAVEDSVAGPASGTGSPTGVDAPAAERSGVPSDASAERHVSCGSPDGWRATTIQRWPDRVLPVRSWIAIDPVKATGPADPLIPLAPVAANLVTAIGYCAPLAARLQPPAESTASLWTLTPTVPLRLTAIGLDPVSLFRQGVLWRPAPELDAVPREGGDAAWPPGRYVIQIADPGGTFQQWLGIEILDLERRPGPDGDPDPGAVDVSAGRSAAG